MDENRDRDTVTSFESDTCPMVKGRPRIGTSYDQFLKDESSLRGTCPEVIYLPGTIAELSSAVRTLAERGTPCTVSGGRTGLAGGAVPVETDTVVSTERITFRPRLRRDSNSGEWIVTVGAGTRLKDLNEILRNGNFDSDETPPAGLFLPVDPTETSATIGGMIATNASGARTLYHGPTRDWVVGLRIVLADGRILSLRRGEGRAVDGFLSLYTESGDTIVLTIEPVTLPPVKHAAGYCLTAEMDPIDLFIGGEGTLGIVAEADLRCTLKPPEHLYLTLYLERPSGPDSGTPRSPDGMDRIHTPDDSMEAELLLTRRVSALVQDIKRCRTLKPVAMEYMDRRSIRLLCEYRREIGEASGVPELPADLAGTLYLEFMLWEESDFDEIYESLLPILATHEIDAEHSWAGFSGSDLEAMKKFRHALPERINAIIAARKREILELTKVGTDMSVPDIHLDAMIEEYVRILSGNSMEYCIFGHIGNGHVHVNILPRDEEELARAWEFYTQFARTAVSFGGSVAAEHGIGRLKRKYMRIQFSERELAGMKAVKEQLDPQGILNPGVMHPGTIGGDDSTHRL